VRSTWCVAGTALAVSLLAAVLLAASGDAPGSAGDLVRTLAGWPRGAAFPLPPAAWAAGLLGALAFGQEFRFPALAPAGVPVPRRLGLLAAKLVVSAAAALALCAAAVVLDAAAIGLLHGAGALRPSPADPAWQRPAVALPLLATGCAWAGLLAAGVLRSATAGLAAVAAVPFAVAPALQGLAARPGDGPAPSLGPFPSSVTAPLHWLSGSWPAAAQLLTRPVGTALTVCLAALLCGYLLTGVWGGARWPKPRRTPAGPPARRLLPNAARFARR
jgi:hypothetical protein